MVRHNIENPMVLDSQLFNPDIQGECSACGCDIKDGDAYYSIGEYLVHDDKDCCYAFVDLISM